MTKRMFHHYELWEDHRAGMYRPGRDVKLVPIAAAVLSDCGVLRSAMTKAATEWTHAAEQNLTNRSRNRQAWLGQAACCITYGVQEDLTRLAWRSLTDEQQDTANAVADEVLDQWDRIQQANRWPWLLPEVAPRLCAVDGASFAAARCERGDA